MKPTSETGWWVVTYTIVLNEPSEDPPRARPWEVRRKQILVRCEHWKEAFLKARRIGITEESTLNSTSERGTQFRWQYLGINALTPIPNEMNEGDVISDCDTSWNPKSLEEHYSECFEDYQFEDSFDEKRGGEYYRAILNSDEAGF